MKADVPKGGGSGLGETAMVPVRLAMAAIDAPLRFVQRRLGIGGMATFFLLPNMLIFGIFVLLPFFINFAYSMTGGTALFLPDRSFVGGDQYARLFDCVNYADPNSCAEDTFWTAVGNTAWFVVLQVTLMILFSLVTALILNRDLMARSFWRAVFFFPVLLSPVVVGLIWKWILQRQGLLNGFIVGLGGEPIDFLSDPTWAFGWVVFLHFWSHMGFYTLLLLAGLQAIPQDLYEAAAMDGTRPWRRFHRITLPLLMPTFLVVVLLVCIRAVQVFDEIFAFTAGGPGRATLFMMQYIYEKGFASSDRNLGLAAAASLVLAAVLLTLSIVSAISQRRNAEQP